MSFKNIHFYNHYGNGDIFISREFVKEICEKIPAENYYYAHAKNKRILADLKFLQWEPITDKHVMRKYYRVEGEDLYINTWMGVTSKYVAPANSCTIGNALRMYNDTLGALGFGPLTQHPFQYLPQPVFISDTGERNFQVQGVIDFIREVDDFILLDNCYVQSNQANNFDFTPIIAELSNNYPNRLFVTTMQTGLNKDNVLFTGDITKTDDGFDLNEISFLSQKSTLLIGRSSGPIVFCMTKYNCFDERKLFLSFTYQMEAAHIIDLGLRFPAQAAWSNANTKEDIMLIMSDVLGKEKDV